MRFAAAFCAAALLRAQGARADLYFDSGGGGTPAGAGGNWDTTSPNWSVSPLGGPYLPWVSGEKAILAGPGGTLIVNEAITASGVDVQSGSQFIDTNGGPALTLENSPAIHVAAGARLAIFAPIDGTEGFTKTGAGLLISENQILGTGPLTIDEGTLRYGSDQAFVPDFTTVITVNAAGTLDLGQTFDYYGTLAGSGTIKLGDISNRGSMTGSQILVGADDSTSSFSGSILGNGGKFDKYGTGTFTLSGANTFNGAVSLRGGTLIVQGGQAIGDNSMVLFDNGNGIGPAGLTLNSNETVGILSGGGTLAGRVNLNGQTLTVAGNNVWGSFDGLLEGAGTFIKTGDGVQMIGTTSGSPAVSTYTGNFIIQQGTLAIRADERLGPNPAALVPAYITLAGGEMANTDAGGFILGGNKGITVTADSSIAVYGSYDAMLQIGAADAAAQITGNKILTKRGPGELRIDTDSGGTFSGSWRVIDGTLSTTRAVPSPLGAGSVELSGARLLLAPAEGSGDVNYAISPLGTGLTFGPGAVLELNRNGNTSFIATFGNPSAANPLGSLLRKPRGTLVISPYFGVNNLGDPANGEALFFAGGAGLADGILPGTIAAAPFSATGVAQVNVGDFAGYDNVKGVIKATYTSSDITASPAGAVVEQLTTVSLAANAQAAALKLGDDFSFVDLDFAGKTLSLGNAAGAPAMLILNNESSLSSSTPGGKLDFGDHQGVIYVGGAQSAVTVTLAGSQGLSKLGPGDLFMQTPAAFTGPLEMNQGSITLTADNQLPNTDVTFNGRAVLNLNGQFQEFKTINGESFAASFGDGGGAIDFGPSGAGTLKLGAGDSVFRGSLIAPTNSPDPSTTLWKAGPGTLILGQVISGGQMPTGVSSPALLYNHLKITDGGVVQVSSYDSLPFANPSSGADLLTYQLDNGTLRMNTLNTNAYLGGAESLVSITGDTAGVTLGAGGGTFDIMQPYEVIALAASLDENSASEIVTGPGGLTKTGPGQLILNAGNTYAGRTIIKQGTLRYTADSALGTAPANVVADAVEIDGGALQSYGSGLLSPNRGVLIGAAGAEFIAAPNNAFNDSNFAIFGSPSARMVIQGPIAGPGTITKSGVSALYLNAANSTFGNSNTGSLVLHAGQTFMNADQAAGSFDIIVDPTQALLFGKSEGPDSTLNNNIIIKSGSLVDIAVFEGASEIPGSVFNGVATGTLTLAGKIGGDGDFLKGFNLSFEETTVFGDSNTAQFSERQAGGTVILSNAANGFTGHLTIETGTVEVPANGALGSPAGSTIVLSAGTLALRGVNYAAAEPLVLSGAGKDSLGALRGIGGDSRFAGPVTINGATSIGVDGGGSLELAGAVAGSAGVTKLGDGRLKLSNPANDLRGAIAINKGSIDFAATHVLPGGLQLAAQTQAVVSAAGGAPHVLRVGSLALDSAAAPTASVDLTQNALIIDYAAASPISDVRSSIIYAYDAAGAARWDRGGITSSSAAADASNRALGYAEASLALNLSGAQTGNWLGQSVDATTVLARYTITGDSNLDGAVGFADLVAVAQHYGLSGGSAVWFQGDFNYDGKVDFADLVAVAQHYNGSLPAAAEALNFPELLSVPEPGGMLFFAAAGLLGARRRRR